MTQNNSGFHGYSAASIYPGWGDGNSQNQETVVEPEEQAVVNPDAGQAVQPAVNPANKKNIWIACGVIAALFLFSSMGAKG